MPAARDAKTRLAQARTRLVLDRPFLGALVLQLPLVEGEDWCRTTATDTQNFYYNPAYIDRLTGEEVQSVLCHEALHCALLHLHRKGHRARGRWDVACDYAVNCLLVAEDMMLPQGALYEPKFADLTAEEIYPCLDEMEDKRTQDLHLYGDSSGHEDSAAGPRPLSQAKQNAMAATWQARVSRALDATRQAGRLSESFERHFSPQLMPRLPWRQLLARHTGALARDDYSYQRTSTRREGPAIYPSLRGREIDLIAALDVSGSVSDAEIAEFVGEVNAIKGTLRARITLLACDQELSSEGPKVFEPWETLEPPTKVSGGGGTSFRPVFEWVNRQDRMPDLLLYFTDAQGRYPDIEPPYPVLWLVKGRAPVPWGERIQLN